MITTEGDVVPQHNRMERLIGDTDYYHDLPTVDAIEAQCDFVTASSMHADEVIWQPGSDPPDVPENQSMAHLEMRDFHEKCSLSALKGKIEAAIGSVMANDGDMQDCPIFTSTLDELESKFQSTISAVDVDTPNGVSPVFFTEDMVYNRGSGSECSSAEYAAEPPVCRWAIGASVFY